jgi:sugar phosphate isomerase/epimerase
VDWLECAGGKCLVVHPGGLSDPEQFPERRAALAIGLLALAAHARPAGILVCVENMPPGVHPGSQMADLAKILAELDHPGLALALDTGHANLGAGLATETRAAGARLATTHVHDNDGRQDSHEPPGHGTIDWSAWRPALDAVGYQGPIILECIRQIRQNPASFMPEVLAGLAQFARPDPSL